MNNDIFVEAGNPDTWAKTYDSKVGMTDPAYTAYRRYGEKGSEKLQVFVGWERTYEKNGTGNLTFTAQWQTVDYGYKSSDIAFYAGTSATFKEYLIVGSSPNPASPVSGTKWAGTDKVVIISGDDFKAMYSQNWFYQNEETETTTGVEYLYLISDSITSIPGSNTFSNMRNLKGIIIDTPELTSFSSKVDGGNDQTKKALEAAAFLAPKLTNKTLPNSMFAYQPFLKTVKLSDDITIWGNYVFQQCPDFDLVGNFGWEYLNKLTSIGTDALQGNLSLPEELILGDGGEHFTSNNYSSKFLKGNTTIKSIKIKWNGTTLPSGLCDWGTYSVTTPSPAPNVESFEIEALNITSAASLSFRNCKELKHIYANMPKVVNASPAANLDGYQSTNVLGASGALENVPVKTLYVTDKANYKGNEDAVFIVGAIMNTGYIAASANCLTDIVYDVQTLTTISSVSSCSELVSFTIYSRRNQVKYMSSSAFQNDSKLVNIVLPEVNVDYMTGRSGNDPSYSGGYAAFKGCVSLRSISNFEHLKSFIMLGNNGNGSAFGTNGIPLEAPAFYGLKDASGLLYWDNAIVGNEGVSGEITIPDYVTEIAPKAFYAAYELTKVDFSKAINLTKIGESAFSNCSKLETVTFGANNTALTTIGNSAFSRCAVLDRVDMSVLPAIETIGMQAFTYCTELTDIKLPKSAGYIEVSYGLFDGCTALKTITIPEQIKVLGGANGGSTGSVFANTGLTSIYFDGVGTIETVGNYLFNRGIMTTTEEGENQAQQILEALVKAMKPGAGGALKLPDYIFYNCAQIKSITIPAEVTGIGQRAFDTCSSLEEFKFAAGSKITTLDNYFLSGATKIKEFEVPASLTSLTSSHISNAFGADLTKLTFAAGSKIVEFSVSLQNTSITELNIPDTCLKFTSSLQNTASLKNVNIVEWKNDKWEVKEENTVYVYGTGANLSPVSFNGSGITEITVKVSSESTQTSASRALYINGTFQNCKSLTKVTLEYFNVTLNSNAFNGCENLEYLKTSSATNFNNANNFTNCNKLATVELYDDTYAHAITKGTTTAGATTAYTTSTALNTAWYKMYQNLGNGTVTSAKLIIGKGIKTYANYAFYLANSDAEIMKKLNIYFAEGESSITNKGTNNSGYDGATKHDELPA